MPDNDFANPNLKPDPIPRKRFNLNLRNLGFKDRFKGFKNKLLIGSILFTVLIIVLSVLWIQRAINRYQNATEYKKSYDIVQEQMKFCQSPKIKEGEDPTIIVHYCDQFKKRFETINPTNTPQK